MTTQPAFASLQGCSKLCIPQRPLQRAGRTDHLVRRLPPAAVDTTDRHHQNFWACRDSREGRSYEGGQATVDSTQQQQRQYRPPPPPPPLPRSTDKTGPWYTLRIVVAGIALTIGWWFFVQSQLPDIQTDQYGVRYVTTAAGNKVMVGEDSRKRLYMMDEAGSLYYDSGNAEVGFFQVTPDEDVYNIYQDASERMQSKLLGKLSDLETVPVESVAGIPFKELRRELHGKYGGALTAFKDTGPARYLPPNAGIDKYKDGQLEGPPILDEYDVTTQLGKDFKPVPQK